jgi:hypothetical protein
MKLSAVSYQLSAAKRKDLESRMDWHRGPGIWILPLAECALESEILNLRSLPRRMRGRALPNKTGDFSG